MGIQKQGRGMLMDERFMKPDISPPFTFWRASGLNSTSRARFQQHCLIFQLIERMILSHSCSLSFWQQQQWMRLYRQESGLRRLSMEPQQSWQECSDISVILATRPMNQFSFQSIMRLSQCQNCWNSRYISSKIRSLASLTCYTILAQCCFLIQFIYVSLERHMFSFQQ